MMNSKILVVDDEPAIRKMLGFALSGEGYQISEAGTGDEAQNTIKKTPPDLILLDWMMPGLSGVDLARRLKRDPETKDLPIIMLSAKGEEQDKIKALDTGADDYVTKPFSTQELLARIRAVLRHSNVLTTAEALEIDDLRIDFETHRVTISGQTLEMSPTEFRLLHFFVTHPERVYSRTQIIDHVWGSNVYIEERTIDVHIRRLRKLLAEHDYDNYIQTVRSIGYRFSKTN